MKTTKKLTNSGTSLVINVTMEARIMGLNRGDYVEIDIKPAEGLDHKGNYIYTIEELEYRLQRRLRP